MMTMMTMERISERGRAEEEEGEEKKGRERDRQKKSRDCPFELLCLFIYFGDFFFFLF